MRTQPRRLRALLVDAGGTLFPDSLSDIPGVREVRVDRLAELLPGLDRERVSRLLDEMTADARATHDGVVQRTDGLLATRLAAMDPALADRAAEVRRLLARATGHEPPSFPGHRDLLAAAGALGLRRVLVSNTDWVSDEDWREWRMSERDIDGMLEGIVTSYSLGRRKPDPAMFERAMELAGCPAAACVFMGDRETKDVEPALALGMTVIRVAIQSPPSSTRAQHQVTSLYDAIEVLRHLTNA